MIGKFKIFMLALLPILFSGCGFLLDNSYFGNIYFVNRASKNIYIAFECENKSYSKGVKHFYTDSYKKVDLDVLIFNSCYTISFYQKRDDSYCLVRKYDLGKLLRARNPSQYRRGISDSSYSNTLVVITPEGYEMMMPNELKKKGYRIPEDIDLCNKNSESIPTKNMEFRNGK